MCVCAFIVILLLYILLLHILLLYLLLLWRQFIYKSINILWIINFKYYRYIASYSSLNMTYAVNKGAVLFRRGQYCTGILLPPGAEVFRYIIATRQLCTGIILPPPPPPGRNQGRQYYTTTPVQLCC